MKWTDILKAPEWKDRSGRRGRIDIGNIDNALISTIVKDKGLPVGDYNMHLDDFDIKLTFKENQGSSFDIDVEIIGEAELYEENTGKTLLKFGKDDFDVELDFESIMLGPNAYDYEFEDYNNGRLIVFISNA
jgi:hypothetical protein